MTIFFVNYHYYLRFFLSNSCHSKIFKTGIRIISIIKGVSIIVYIIMNV